MIDKWIWDESGMIPMGRDGDFVKESDYDALHKLARDLALAVKNTADQLEAAGGPMPTFRALVKEWEALNRVMSSDTFTLPTEVPDEFNF